MRHLGDSGNVGSTLEFLSPFLWRAPLLRCDGNAGNSFPNTQGEDPSSRARRRKQGSFGCRRNSPASSRVETRMLGNFLSCIKGLMHPLEVPEDTWISLDTLQRKWASSRLEGRTSWISRVAEGALDLRRGPQRPALGASGKVRPHASCSGASRDSSPVNVGT